MTAGDLNIEGLMEDVEGAYKVVELYLDGEPWLTCAPARHCFHRDILSFFLKQHEVDFQEVPSRISTEWTIPALKGERYRVVGMGAMEYYPGERSMQLPYGTSMEYKIGTRPEFNAMLKEKFDGWNF